MALIHLKTTNAKWVKIPLLPENVYKISANRPQDPREGNNNGFLAVFL